MKTTLPLAVLALGLALPSPQPVRAQAQGQAQAVDGPSPAGTQADGDAANAARETGGDPLLTRKVTRLRIAGWSFVGSASVFLVGAIFGQGAGGPDSDGGKGLATAIGLGMTSAALLTTGGALLLRARLLLHRSDDDRDRSVALDVMPGGARLRWRF